MKDISIIAEYAAELEAEVPATRKCIERIPENLFEWRPHERSMTLGYLVLLVAEIPRWIAVMIQDKEINFETFKHEQPKTTNDMVIFFDNNVKDARSALTQLTTNDLLQNFVLRSGDNIMINSPLKDNISSTLNHWVHHRGQLTVYMRLNNIMVPSIYGPSADDNSFKKS